MSASWPPFESTHVGRPAHPAMLPGPYPAWAAEGLEVKAFSAPPRAVTITLCDVKK